jgi:chromosome partitioning protein
MDGKIISVLNLKGGVGKTTITTNMAVELYNRHQKVLVIDADPQFNSTQTLMKFYEKNLDEYFSLLSQRRTLVQVFSSAPTTRGISVSTESEEEVQDGIIHSLAEAEGGKLDIIPGDMDLIIDATNAGFDRFPAFIKTSGIRTDYDFVLIDCPPTWGTLTSVALSVSDYYLIPTSLDEFSTIGVTLLGKLLSDKVKSVERPLRNLGVVYTFLKNNTAADGIARDQKVFRDEIEDYFTKEMPDLVGSPVRPFHTVFYRDRFFITRSALYFTDEALEKRPSTSQKVKELVDEVFSRVEEREGE